MEELKSMGLPVRGSISVQLRMNKYTNDSGRTSNNELNKVDLKRNFWFIGIKTYFWNIYFSY